MVHVAPMKVIVHTVHARHMLVAPVLATSSDLAPEKLRGLVDFLRHGGHVPAVVAARYGKTLVPLDGAYRIAAHAELGKEVDAWLISGTSYDKLCDLTNRPEDYVMCGTVPAMAVAEGFGPAHANATRGVPSKQRSGGRPGVAEEPEIAADLIDTEFRTTWWD